MLNIDNKTSLDENKNYAGKLIIIVGPSGTGKSELLKKIKFHFPKIEESISFTTRPTRIGEINGKDYFFITEDEFHKKKEKGDFFEWAKVHSNFYGTDIHFIKRKIQNGSFIVLDLDVQGAIFIQKNYRDLVKTIFIMPPSIDELKKRLLGRSTDSIEVIEERVRNAKLEIKQKSLFDHILINDNFDQCLENLKNIIKEIIN